LQRYGQTGASTYGLVDNLTYTLVGNQITKVEDAVTTSSYSGGTNFVNGSSTENEYSYDYNGNLTKDSNKGIVNISWNSLNLPSVVSFNDGSTITYLYAADGIKLRAVYHIGGTTTQTDYAGNVLYENGMPKSWLTEAGYISMDDNKYHYYLQDHQGNNRVVVSENGAVEEVNHYYAFGGLFGNGNSVQPFKYNGKELDTKKGLNWYDYGARQYDAALGRWFAVDPLAEEYYNWSPYVYCLNTPVLLIDKDGMLPGPGDLFNTPRDAAKDWGMYYNGTSIINKREMASSIYSKDGKYFYTKAQTLGAHGGKIIVESNTVATIHSHGEYTGLISNGGILYKVEDNPFSRSDIKASEEIGLIGFLATPNGSLLEYNPENQKIEIVSMNLPSDPNDPGRLNEIPPVDNRSFWEKITDFIMNLF